MKTAVKPSLWSFLFWSACFLVSGNPDATEIEPQGPGGEYDWNIPVLQKKNGVYSVLPLEL